MTSTYHLPSLNITHVCIDFVQFVISNVSGNMSVTNYWTNYYLNQRGKLKRRKKTFVPKYLKRSKTVSDFSSSPNLDSKLYRGWNRSAYFRLKANKNYIDQLEDGQNEKKAKSMPGSRIISPLKPRFRAKKKENLSPLEILSKFRSYITGKVVIVTPNLVVTRTSPTPEDVSPTSEFKVN